MDVWAYHNGVKIDFSRPGKPTDNACVESFNGTLREECLDAHWFSDLAEARQLNRGLEIGIESSSQGPRGADAKTSPQQNATPAQPEAKKAPDQGEVLPPEVIDAVRDKVGERGRNRTFNLLIKSQLLCQLSYAPNPYLLQ